VTPMDDAPEGQTVRGERSEALVHAARSVQSRVSSVLASGLMIVLGVSALTWYYARALTRPTHARVAAQSATANRAQGEMPLPSLGPIAGAAPARTPAGLQGVPEVASPTMTVAPTEVPLTEARGISTNWGVGTTRVASGADAGPGATTSPKTPAELARERRLSGGVFARESQSVASAVSGEGGAVGAPAVTRSAPDAFAADGPRPSEGRDGSLSVLLRPSMATAVQAQLLPAARFLLPKGAFIDCTLETAIDSTLPGMTTCITAADTFGADGKVVLLERGSKLVGETRGQVQQGQARVFVVWTQARTPAGVVVPLDSPGTDELGRSGLPGEVQHHFWERFGAAILISVVDGAVQAGVQASNHSGGAVIYAPSASQDVATEVLKDTVNIPPTVVKHNGDRIEVLVARDLDFRSVYELRTPPTSR
jgi:type IV secretion system protein VirB10